MQRLHQLLGGTAFLSAIWGCTLASAADGSPPPHRKPPQEAFDACKSLSEGAACSVTFRGQTMTGTCRKGPRGESELACVPAHPPGPPPSDTNQTLTDTALERKLDQLEREIRGS